MRTLRFCCIFDVECNLGQGKNTSSFGMHLKLGRILIFAIAYAGVEIMILSYKECRRAHSCSHCSLQKGNLLLTLLPQNNLMVALLLP